MKRNMVNRYIKVASLFSCLFIVLIIRIYIIQQSYENKTMPTSAKGGKQTEKISEKDYQVYDCSGKNIANINKKYVLVIDVNAFKMNNIKECQESLLAFNYIMKSQYTDFSLDTIITKSGKIYFDKIDEESYEKLNELTKTIKGIYLYKYDYLYNKEAWKIEKIFTQLNNNGNTDDDTLENKLLKTMGANKDNTVSLTINSKGFYTNETYNIDDNNLSPQLTLNEDWQEKVRETLNKKDFDNLPNIGVAIVESSTGKIKVMAQKDESQPNVLIGATGIGYPPGSIFKIIDEMAAISENKLDLTKKYVCNGVLCKKNGKPHPHGTLNLNEALKVSCNEAFSQLGAKIGYDSIMNMCKKVGLFQKVLSLKDESTGVSPEKVSGMNNISIGQTFNVTPIQMTSVISTIVNDGIYIKPTILEGYKDNNNKLISLSNSNKERVLNSNSALIIKNQLKDVVTSGSGVKAQVAGMEVGGKTGTAEGGASNHIWFLGFFKQDNKYYSMVVFVPNLTGVNEAGDNFGGGNTAAPIFRQVVEALKK